MKRLHAEQYFSTSKQVSNTPLFTIHDQLFSEQDIIALHKLFLTVGVHSITVASVRQGRSLVKTFLESLNCYHNLAMVTLENIPLLFPVLDVYRGLLEKGYVNPISSIKHSALDQFFVDDFFADFMWIESSQELLSSDWFIEFKQKLVNLNIDKHIPIIMVRYS